MERDAGISMELHSNETDDDCVNLYNVNVLNLWLAQESSKDTAEAKAGHQDSPTRL
jgi:hypothetical protein